LKWWYCREDCYHGWRMPASWNICIRRGFGRSLCLEIGVSKM